MTATDAVGVPPGAPGRAPSDGTLGDGLAMSLAAGGAALVGMLGWIVAARVLTPEELGSATAFVSGFLLIAGITELNLGVGLLRWLPRAGSAARRLLVVGLLTISGLGAVVAVLYLLLPGSSVIVDAVTGGPGGNRLGGAAIFVLAAVCYALFQQQDFVLVGLRRPWWAPARTVVFAVGRLGMLFAAGASLTTGLVVASWVVPTAACVVLVTAQAAWLTRRRARTAPAGVLPSRREALGFLGPTYLGQVATSVLLNQVPLLVVFRFGTADGAAFFLLWQAVTVVDVVATYFATSLAAGVAREPHRAAELSRTTLRRLLVIVLPLLGIGALVAGPVLSLFGPVYAAQAPVLQILIGGLALRMLIVHRLGEHQAFGRSVRFARLALTATALVVAVVALVPTDAADPLRLIAYGVVGVQGLVAAVVTVRRLREPTPVVRGGPAAPAAPAAPATPETGAAS